MYLLSLTFLDSLTLNRMILLRLYLGRIIPFLGTFVGFESKLGPHDINFCILRTSSINDGLD